jgi:hypothetical protein
MRNARDFERTDATGHCARRSQQDETRKTLDRIEIPQDVVERISELLTPGSSLIVSDYGISEETGKDTDFIVVTQ